MSIIIKREDVIKAISDYFYLKQMSLPVKRYGNAGKELEILKDNSNLITAVNCISPVSKINEITIILPDYCKGCDRIELETSTGSQGGKRHDCSHREFCEYQQRRLHETNSI